VANKWNGWKPEIESKPGPMEEAAATPDAEAPKAADRAPDADGVVRTKTGWRRLLPDILGGDKGPR
jgi:hypothetical protein